MTWERIQNRIRPLPPVVMTESLPGRESWIRQFMESGGAERPMNAWKKGEWDAALIAWQKELRRRDSDANGLNQRELF